MRCLRLWLAIAIFGAVAPAAAADLRISNCTNDTPPVETYNYDDTVCWIPYSTATLSSCRTVALGCFGGEECKVKIKGQDPRMQPFECSYHNSDLKSGDHVYSTWGLWEKSSLVDDPDLWARYCKCAQADMQW